MKEKIMKMYIANSIKMLQEAMDKLNEADDLTTADLKRIHERAVAAFHAAGYLDDEIDGE